MSTSSSSRPWPRDPDWTCLLELLHAITAYGTGDLAAARRHLARSLTLATASAPHHLPELIATRAVIDAAAGDRDAAVAGARESLARIGATISAVHHVTVVPKAALALLDAGHPGEALDLLERAGQQATSRFGIEPTATMATNAGWAALGLDRTEPAVAWFTRALVGPQPIEAMGTIAEASLGLSCALAHRDPAAAVELLGLGDLLLESAGQVLPPSLHARTETARRRLGPTQILTGWTPDLAVTRIRQLARQAGRGPSHQH